MEMLKRLQEEKVVVELDEEDEVLIKSITFRNSKDYVKRIKKVDDDDEDFAIPGQSSVTSKARFVLRKGSSLRIEVQPTGDMVMCATAKGCRCMTLLLSLPTRLFPVLEVRCGHAPTSNSERSFGGQGGELVHGFLEVVLMKNTSKPSIAAIGRQGRSESASVTVVKATITF
ncbi:uncharacterized protein LOC119350582 [Triticum dicoccoides]|uniref:uncharacterized protein LOC119350582 n=1 Tax=Triticum dicoccoides TaxID=85692 RepID=UPI00188EECA1|nr:uncharacterized protein LOC119350582 [Triticum dicoccoides]